MAGAFDFAFSLDGSNIPPATYELPVAATQSLKAGDPVMLASGKVTAGSAGTFGRCAGVMAEDSDNQAAGTPVKVYIPLPHHVWRATASADATSHVLAARSYDLTTGSVINVADTTGGCIQIVGLQPGSVTAVFAVFTATEF